jgi:hypothetical protein
MMGDQMICGLRNENHGMHGIHVKREVNFGADVLAI